jgi:hypothetical protein
MNIFVRIANTGLQISLAVTKESTVANVKAMIETKENVHSQYQNLLFSGNLLDNDTSKLCELNISAESTLTLALRIDSGHEVAARFVGLETIPQVFEQIVFVKEKNEELYAQIQAIVKVKRLRYNVEYTIREDGSPSFQVVERETMVAASTIIDEFEMDGNMIEVRDYLCDRIVYDIRSLSDLVRLNTEMFCVAEKFMDLFAEGSDKMRAVMLEYGANYCTLFRNLTRVLRIELVDDVSKQATMDAHAAVVMAQCQQLGALGAEFGPPFYFKESVILTDNAFDATLKQWLVEKGRRIDSTVNLLYRGSIHGKAASNFHTQCDNKGPTITLVRCTGGNIFGGFAPLPWISRQAYSSADNSFLFSLVNPRGAPPQKFDLIKTGDANAIYDSGSYGPTFGGGHDLHIGNNWNGCYTKLGITYAYPTGLGDKTFTGASSFTPAEVEVWQVVG